MHARQGGGFPAEYNRSIFIAEHGSWARSVPIGYRSTYIIPCLGGIRSSTGTQCTVAAADVGDACLV